MGGTFVGRARELDVMQDAYRAARAGRGGLLLLVGEPGIGKTRLCDELCARAQADAVHVFWGRSWEGGGAPAYFPILQVLRGVLRAFGRDACRTMLGDHVRELVPLLPELAQPDEPIHAATGAAGDMADARFRLGVALSALLAQAAEQAPIVIVLDDLHAADVSSLALLRVLARELRALRVLVLATYRDSEVNLQPELAQAIAALAREGRSLALPRLPEDESARFVRDVAGEVAPEVLAMLHEATQGNPLFLDEVARLLVLEGGLDRARSVRELPIPYGVREAIRMRLSHLPEAARELLATASVIGSEVTLGLLGALAQQTPDALRAALEACRAAGALRSLGADTYAFSHPLIREVLYRDLPRGRRMALHEQVAVALARTTGDAPDAAAAIAHHQIEAGVPDPHALVQHALRAAAHAHRLAAYDGAAALLERSADALQAAAADAGLICDVWLALGHARVLGRARAQGRQACEHAAALARKLGDSERLARAALALGADFVPAVVDTGLVALLEEALAALPEDRVGLRAQVMARLAAARQPALDPMAEVARGWQAIELARAHGDPATLLEVEHAAMGAFMDYEDPRKRLRLNAEICERAAAIGDLNKQWRATLRMIYDGMESGEVSGVPARIAQLEQIGERSFPLRAHQPLLCRAMLAMFGGDFAAAETYAARARAFVEEHAIADAEIPLLVQRVVFCRLADRNDELSAHEAVFLRMFSAIPDAAPFAPLASAMIAARRGDVARVQSSVDASPKDQLETYVDIVQVFLAEALPLIDEPRLAEGVYRTLLPRAELNISWGISGAACEGSVHRLLAFVSIALGERARASQHFEAGIARDRATGARPSLVRTLIEYAELLCGARGEDGGDARAAQLLGEARRLAAELGIASLGERASALERGLPGSKSAMSREPPAATAAAPRVSLKLEGEFWSVSCDEAVFRLKDSRGLRILAQLLAEPFREFHVIDLAGGGGSGAPPASDAGPAIDRQARDEYRRRAEDLRETIAEAESFGDSHRAERARAELEALASELARSVGLGGRERRSNAAAERARVAVQRRVRDAIDRIAAHAPVLGDHLDRCVRTGAFCAYEPGPERR